MCLLHVANPSLQGTCALSRKMLVSIQTSAEYCQFLIPCTVFRVNFQGDYFLIFYWWFYWIFLAYFTESTQCLVYVLYLLLYWSYIATKICSKYSSNLPYGEKISNDPHPECKDTWLGHDWNDVLLSIASRGEYSASWRRHMAIHSVPTGMQHGPIETAAYGCAMKIKGIFSFFSLVW